MRCPQCQFVSSDKKDLCPKCSLDLRPHKKALGLTISNHTASVEQLKLEQQKQTAAKSATPPPASANKTVSASPTSAKASTASKFEPTKADSAVKVPGSFLSKFGFGKTKPARTPAKPEAVALHDAAQIVPQLSDDPLPLSLDEDESLEPSAYQLSPADTAPISLPDEAPLPTANPTLDMLIAELERDVIEEKLPEEAHAETPEAATPEDILETFTSVAETAIEDAVLATGKIGQMNFTPESEETVPQSKVMFTPEIVAPEIVEFGDDEQSIDDQLKNLLGDEDLELNVEAVKVHKPEPIQESSDDDFEISIEFDEEDDDSEFDAEEIEEESEKEVVEEAPPQVVATVSTDSSDDEVSFTEDILEAPRVLEDTAEDEAIRALLADIDLEERSEQNSAENNTAEGTSENSSEVSSAESQAKFSPSPESSSTEARVRSNDTSQQSIHQRTLVDFLAKTYRVNVSALRHDSELFDLIQTLDSKLSGMEVSDAAEPDVELTIDFSESGVPDVPPEDAWIVNQLRESETEDYTLKTLEEVLPKSTPKEEVVVAPIVVAPDVVTETVAIPAATPAVIPTVNPTPQPLLETEPESVSEFVELPVVVEATAEAPPVVPMLDYEAIEQLWDVAAATIEILSRDQEEDDEISMADVFELKPDNKRDLYFEMIEAELETPTSEIKDVYKTAEITPSVTARTVENQELSKALREYQTEEAVVSVIRQSGTIRSSKTAHAPAQTLKPTRPWKRSAAWALDFTRSGFIGFGFSLFVFLPSELRTSVLNRDVTAVPELFQFLPTIFSCIACVWALTTLLEVASKGQTIGQRLLKITVTDTTGNPVAFGQAVLWTLAQFTTFLTCGIGFALAFLKTGRTLHDKLACTVVSDT